MKKGKKILIGVTGALVAGIAGITIGGKIREEISIDRVRAMYGVPMGIPTFNSNFTVYEGSAVSAVQVKALLSLIEVRNAQNGFTTVPNDLNTDKYVYLNSTTDNAIISVEQVEKDKTYKVEITGYSHGGYVNEITITENETNEQ